MKVSYEEVVIITAIATVTYKVVCSVYDFVLRTLSKKG